MSYPRRVADIAAEIEALTDGDPEASHARADDLLVETIERLAPYATETTDEAEADRVILAWKRLRKWYA